MLIRSFEVKNYKGFKDRQTIELAPLTLLYGENSSGKSALLRLLPLIAESMRDRRPGPVLDGAVGREALWGDLVHISSPRNNPIEIKLTWSTGHEAEWSLRGGTLPGSCELKSIELISPERKWSLSDDGDGTWQGEIPGVSGLLPTLDDLQWEQTIGARRHDFDLDVQWLQGIRASVPRVEKGLASSPGELSPTGDGVARFLYQWARNARSTNENLALNFVLEFFKTLKFDLRVVDVAPGFFRLEVAPLGNPDATNLVDTGEGLTQVLAPLVALARAVHGLGPRIVCLEQPELHLHTDAQRALGKAIAKAARDGAQVLVETHSEVLLAEVQLAVAVRPQRISANDVALYWVERRREAVSVARRVLLDERGRVGGAWPIDAFDDLLQLKSELLLAQRSEP